MADKIVKITFEIDGLEQSVSNIDDAKVALQQLESQAKETESAAAGAADEFKDLGNAAKDAGEGGEGAITVLDEATGGLASRFTNVIKGVKQMGKSLVTSFKAGVKGASSLKVGIAATGIGLLVVALGAIVAYWDDIVGLVNGVSGQQRQLNKEVEDNVKLQQESLDAISAQENSLKLQGKSEEEIRQLKIDQTNEVIQATILQLEQMEATKKAQVAAAQRNKDIAQGVIAFLTLPITILLGTVDAMTKALSLIPGIDIGTNLADDFTGGIAGMIFDPEEVATEGQATIDETTAQLTKLKNSRDGIILQSQKADQAASEKAKADREKLTADELAAAEKLAADKKAIKDKEDAEAATRLAKEIADAQIVKDLLQQADLDLIQSAYDRAQAELEIQRVADVEKITQAGATADEIARINKRYSDKKDKLEQENSDFKEELNGQDVDNALAAGSQVLGSIISIVGEGSAVGKAAAIAQTTIDTYSSATAAYSSVVGIPIVGPALAPIAAGVAVAAGLMSIKKIVSTKTPGNKSAGAPPGISVPSAPTFNPTTALQAGADADQDANTQVTLGEQTGSGPAVVRAYVVSSEVTGQQEADAKINDLARL
jgi:hypothetical protein|tara:strand:+ start:1719 stop:3524 length:1806 start_codon:yes stop_codon:yes gene_type:complete